MEENKDIEPVRPVDESIDNDPPPIIENPETPAMEVHHHTHPSHGKKTWKNYFWEFLMLFLAVFCGFLAEYQLEHVIESQREKQYIESLVEDLKTDQNIMKSHLASVKSSAAMMDSLIAILNEPSRVSSRTDDLYYLARLSPRLDPLANSSRTFDQLKNSGNFRLIRNIKVSNKIMSYYERFPLVRMLESINETEFTEYKKLAAKIFSPAVLVKQEGLSNEIIKGTDNPPLRTTEPNLLMELSVFAVYMHGTRKGIINAEEALQISGTELIKYLETEYNVH